MKFRKLIVLLVVLAALAAAALSKKAVMDKARHSSAEEAIKTEAPLGAEVTPGLVTKLEIKHGDETLALSKDGERWSVPTHFNAKARVDAVDNLLKKLENVRGEIRSENPAVLEDFDLSDAKAIHLRLSGAGDKELAHLLVSPQRPRGTQNFVRLADSLKVIATTSDILADLGIFSKTDKLDYLNFADLRVAGFDSSKVASFELIPEGGSTLSFVKKEGGPVAWALDGEPSTEIETQKINEFFAAVLNLYSNGNVDPATAGVTSSMPALRFHMKAGEKPETIEIWAGARDAEKKTVLLKTMPEGLVYSINETALNVLKKPKDFFLKPKAS